MPANASLTPETCRFNESDAGDILLAQVAEQHFKETGQWSAEEEKRATRDARELAGDDQSPETLLPLRARLVLARLKPVLSDLSGLKKPSSLIMPVTLGLTVLSYFAGAMTDRLTTDGARINLLAAPLLLLLVWNLCVYVLLILKSLRLFPRLSLPLREGLAKVLSGFKWAGLKQHALKAGFASLWAEAQLPRLHLCAARAFHLAAAAFAVGILTSILVRGIGTAWQIGWESTWFADSPEAVRAIIRFTYGLIPLDIIGLAPIPDTDAIAALRFDLGNAVRAAPWLCRLMALLFCVVILPRLLLAGWVTYRMQLAQKRISVKTNSPYYRGILTVKPLLPLWTGFIIDSADEAILSSDKWRTFEKAFRSTSPDQSFNTIVCNAWEASPETVLKSIPEAEAYRIMLVLDPMNTPEDEVHGTLLSALSDWCSKTLSPSLTVILDCSTLNRRIGNNAARVALWETFISDRHAVTLSADFDNPESLQALQRSIRALRS